MNLGFFTACLPDKGLEEILPFAQQNGFTVLEVAAWPQRTDRDFAGITVDVEKFTPEKATQINGLFAKHQVAISSLGYYDNHLDPNLKEREYRINHLRKVIDAAALLECNLVGTFIGRDPNKNIKDNFTEFGTVFKPIIKYAAGKNVKIMIENCPMVGWQFEGLPGTISYSPELWTKMFDLIPDDNFGLNYDPSHIYWLCGEYIAPVKKFAKRVFHVHAKDTEILKDGLSEHTIHGNDWWRYRIPGLGEINWQRFVLALQEIGYDGAISIEHEDPVWGGSEEKTKKGLILGARHLLPLLI